MRRKDLNTSTNLHDWLSRKVQQYRQQVFFIKSQYSSSRLESAVKIKCKIQNWQQNVFFVKSRNGDHGADLALIIMPFDLLHQLCLSALSKQYGEWVGCDQNADTGFPQTCSFFLLQGNNDHDM